MRRILTVNIMILLIFASVSYWMEEGEKLKDTMASAETIQAEVSEPEVEKKYIKGVDFQVSCLALSESYEYDRDTYGTDHISAGSICWPGQRHIPEEAFQMTGKCAAC